MKKKLTKNLNKFSYEKNFDILRAISVLLVILFHLNEDLFSFGFVGVDIFFFISGFVITQSLFNYYFNKGSIGFIVNFFFRRIKRILPVLILVLIASILVFLLIIPYGDHQMLWTSKSLIFSIFGLSNIYFYKNIDNFNYFDFENTTPFLHTWSLGVEEQFYLIFPFIIIFFLKNQFRFNYIYLFLLLIYLISLYIFVTNNKFLGHFYLLPSRAWEILFGSIFFLYKNREKLNLNISRFYFIGLILLKFFILIYLFLFFDVDYRHIVILTLLILSLLIFFKKEEYNFYGNSFLVYVGKISYSLYLWHFPIIFFTAYYFSQITFIFLVVLFTFACSVISYHFVEIPFRKIQIHLKKIRIFYANILFLIFCIFFLNFNNIINIRNSIHNFTVDLNKTFIDLNISKKSLNKRISNKWFLDNDNCKKKIENFKSYNYLNCIRDINNNRLFYLAGDSFGEHFLNVLTFSDKKIIENIYLSKVENENFLPNNTLNIQSINNFKKISKNYKDKYFIFSISYRNETKKESLVKFFQNLKNFNVIIIRPHQRSNKNVKECFTKQKILNEKIEEKNCLYEKKFDQARINRINLILDELKLSYNNIKLFDFNELICIDEQCKIYNKDEDLILFTDNTHLTVEASKLISLHFQNWLINEYNNSF